MVGGITPSRNAITQKSASSAPVAPIMCPVMDLVDEIERTLGMPVVPCTWPVGMGKQFKGVFDLLHDSMRVFIAGEDRVGGHDTIAGLNNPEAAERFGDVPLGGASDGAEGDHANSGEP